MSLVNLVTQVGPSMVSKLPTVTIKLANGREMLVVDANLNGDILAALLTWNSFNKDHSNHDEDGMAVGGQDGTVDKDSSEWQELFIKQILMKGIAFLVELSETAIRLEMWSLFELCSKKLASQIVDKDSKKIIHLSAPCIKGLLKYLSIEKRHEFDTIESKEWQDASYGLWSEQKVLRFGSGQVDMVDCKHTAAGLDEANLVECTQDELDTNRKSIELNDERKCPDKFLDIVRKCTNLEMISWGSDFGEMADPEFAYVLKMSCPQLEHVQGLVRKKFEEYQICPASFINVFKRDKNITCYHVKYDKVNETKGLKTAEQLRAEFEKANLKLAEDFMARYYEQALSKMAKDARNVELEKIRKQRQTEIRLNSFKRNSCCIA